MIRAMFPKAEVRHLGNRARQVWWMDGNFECSISEFISPIDMKQIKKAAFGMNDVQFLGNFRFARTHTGAGE